MPIKPPVFTSSLSAAQIAAVEAAAAILNPASPVEAIEEVHRCARTYQSELRRQDSEAGLRNLAKLKEVSQAGFNRVFAVLSEDQKAGVLDYIASLGGKVVPDGPIIKIISVVNGNILGG